MHYAKPFVFNNVIVHLVMQLYKNKRASNSFFLILFAMLLIYIIARAFYLDMTHDEAYSFHNVKQFWYVEALCTGNTHWFNFGAIKLAILCGLETAVQLRWFSLVASGAFFVIAFLWIKGIKQFPIQLFAFSCLALNPYVIDYQSLARGYSAGLLFEALSLCFLMISISKQKRVYSVLALLFAGCSAIANFNFFYFFSSYSLLYFYLTYFKHGFNFFKEKRFYLDTIIVMGVTLLVLRALMFITECSNDIGAYGGNSLVPSIFYGLIDGLTYRNSSWSSNTIAVGGWSLFISFLFMSLYGILKYKSHQHKLYTFASAIFLLMLSLTVINKLAFNVLYPTYRTTLMFYPLMAIISISFIETLSVRSILKQSILYSMSGLCIINFIFSINFKSTFDYYEQADSKNCFNYLKEIGAKRVGVAPELYGVYVNYYQLTENYSYPFKGESINTCIPILPKMRYENTLQDFDYLVLFPPYDISYYKYNKVKLEYAKLFWYSRTMVVKVINKS